MGTEEKAYWNKEVAETLGIGESTLRKWCLELEKNGYSFVRGYKDSRAFLQYDLDALNYYRKLTKEGHYKMEQAAKIVVEKYGDRKEENDRTASVPEEIERSESVLTESIRELLRISEEQKNIMSEQLELNKELFKKLSERDYLIDQQQKQIDLILEMNDKVLLIEQLKTPEQEANYLAEKPSEYDRSAEKKEQDENMPKKKGLISKIGSLFKSERP